MVQGGRFSNFGQFLWDLWKETGNHWYNYGMWPIILVYLFLSKTTEMIKIHFKHYVGKYGPDTEFDRNFCAGIGPLHLGVVLVYRYVNFEILNAFCFKICDDLEGKLCKQWRWWNVLLKMNENFELFKKNSVFNIFLIHYNRLKRVLSFFHETPVIPSPFLTFSPLGVISYLNSNRTDMLPCRFEIISRSSKCSLTLCLT